MKSLSSIILVVVTLTVAGSVAGDDKMIEHVFADGKYVVTIPANWVLRADASADLCVHSRLLNDSDWPVVVKVYSEYDRKWTNINDLYSLAHAEMESSISNANYKIVSLEMFVHPEGMQGMKLNILDIKSKLSQQIMQYFLQFDYPTCVWFMINCGRPLSDAEKVLIDDIVNSLRKTKEPEHMPPEKRGEAPRP